MMLQTASLHTRLGVEVGAPLVEVSQTKTLSPKHYAWTNELWHDETYSVD